MIKNNFDDVYYPENIKEILYKNVDEKMVDHIHRENSDHLEETAQTLFGVKFTYKDLFDNISKYAKALKSYGLTKGDCITLAMPNIPETIYYFYACNMIGVTAYLIDPRSTFNNMVACINNSHSKLFVCEMTTYYDKVAKNVNHLPVDNVVVVSPLNAINGQKNLNSKLIIAKHLLSVKETINQIKYDSKDNNKKYSQNDLLKWGDHFIGSYKAPYSPDIPAIIVNTSGTTGNSIKGAMHSNKTYNIYANEAQFVTDQLERGNTFYGYIPYFSMYGSCVGMHVALSYGITIHNVPKYGGIKTLEDIIDSKANIMIGTPNMLEKLTDMYVKNDIDASHVKQYIIGGDAISPEKLKYQDEALMQRGMKKKMVYGYGATECLPAITFTPDERSHVYGSCGIVYPMAHIKVIDPDTGIELPHGEQGELYINNPTLMMGYLNNPEETEYVFKTINGKKYYRTGDKGYLTDDGIAYVTGRYKRLMKRPDCHQVTPIPIENAINDCSLVKDCAVVGIKKKNGMPGVIPTAFIVLKDGIDVKNEGSLLVMLQQIAEESLDKIGNDKEMALAYVLTNSIPYTNNGKVDFKALEKYTFDDLNFYAINDSVANEYFAEMPIKRFSIDKNLTRTLKK